MTEPNPADVTQADRDAAAEVWIRGYDFGSVAAIREGNCDNHPLVQAFARHRIAALQHSRSAVIEECAKVAEGKSHDSVLCTPAGRAKDIAKAIRALAD